MPDYKVRRFSNEHIHVAEMHDGHVQEECFMSRNWNRCTASELTVEQYESGPLDGDDLSYHDGDNWVDAPLSDYCPLCQEIPA